MYKFVCGIIVFFALVVVSISCEHSLSHIRVQDNITVKETRNNDNTPICRYRDLLQLYPPNLWIFLSGAFCYSWAQPERMDGLKLDLLATPLTQDNVTYVIPYVKINGTPVLFDYTDEGYSSQVRTLFSRENYFKKWIECCEDAVACCEFMNKDNVFPTDKYPCPATWDGWACSPPAAADTTTYFTCPPHTYTSDDIVCIMEAERYCLANGTWNQSTNYEVCASAPIYRRRHTFHIIVLYISTALSFPAVVIFIVLPKLRILRIILHRNLLIAILLKNILVLISKETVILDSLKPPEETNNVLYDSGIGCTILAFIENVSKNAVFTCMLVDGFYLHKSIVRVFSPDPNIYVMYAVVIVFSVLPSTIWAILMGVSGKEYCWMVDSESWYQWITDGYKFFILGLNLILLLDIVRVLLLKRSKNNTRQSKSALKATLFLIPLFGVPLLFTAQRSLLVTDSCLSGDIYNYVTYLVEAAQGVTVALLFCYCNNEVHREIKNVYRKFTILLETRYGINIRKAPNRRRTTAFTNVRTSAYEDEAPNISGNISRKSLTSENKVKSWLITGNIQDDTNGSESVA